ncbi:hypothetical protein JK165_04620 [Acetobacter okinawensis]|uniref:hypothetical protein n=1 Tax=Acetobacter okinawensis TaxID=1076594 RepID=UPI001BADB392|nr:hypothetical protein [Acetobacter okinawensis]MBS0965388.1 hypothetical protein [Acetobacter okinawensis]
MEKGSAQISRSVRQVRIGCEEGASIMNMGVVQSAIHHAAHGELPARWWPEPGLRWLGRTLYAGYGVFTAP